MGTMLNRTKPISIATGTVFSFIAIFCSPLYRTERVIAQSPPAQDAISQLQREVSKRGKSPEEVDRVMRDRFPNPCFPYYEPVNGCSTPGGISLGWGNNELFRDACNKHDICYATPGNTKRYCDDELLREMLRICENGSRFCSSWAQGYYKGVNSGGQDAYDAAQRQQREYIRSVYAWLNKPSGQAWVLISPSFWQRNNQCSVGEPVMKITLLQSENQLRGTVRTVWNGVWEDTPVSGSISGRDVQLSFTRGFTVTFNGKLDQDSKVHGTAKGCGGTQADFSMTRDNS